MATRPNFRSQPHSTQPWPRPHEGYPRGVVGSHRNQVNYITFFSDTLHGELVFLKCNDY